MVKKVHMVVRPARKQSERAIATRYYCSANDCPLLKIGKCIHVQPLGVCKYGSVSTTQTSTKRAKKYHSELSELENEKREFPKATSYYSKDIVKIDDYYYLPYAHMTMCESVPFVSHSNLFLSGTPFLHEDDFNVENIIKLVKFRPQAFFGGEILSYQKESVPAFLLNLKTKFPKLYKECLAVLPSIKDKIPKLADVESLTAKLSDIPAGTVNFKVMVGSKNYFEVLEYDGTNITIRGPHSALITIIGPRSNSNCTITIEDVIKDKTDVLIEDQELIKTVLENNPSLYIR